jgi:hypothetical protein
MSHPTRSDAAPHSSPAKKAAETQEAGKPPLTPAAERALAEAVGRRAERARQDVERQDVERQDAGQPKEVGGRDGPEPTRYGDWEINGLTSDF